MRLTFKVMARALCEMMDGEMRGAIDNRANSRQKPHMSDVDVWLVNLPDNGEIPEGYSTLLSPEESARAARFVFDRDRAKFTVAHVALRHILAPYANAPAASLQIQAAERGKPFLAEHPAIRFNLSHSGSCALLAVTHNRELGVDIECLKPDRSSEDIVRRFFAPAEVAALMSTPPDQRVAAFFACWSRKEAYIKARGEGLHIALDSFEVSLGEDAALLHAEDKARWSMYALQAPPGYAAALVVEGSAPTVRQLEWSGHPEI